MVLQGDHGGAALEARRAQEIEPLAPNVNAGAAHTLFLARRYDQAVTECEKSLEVDSNFIFAIHLMGMCRAQQSRLNEAIEIGERTVSLSARAPFYLGVLGHYYARNGATDKVHDILEELTGLAGTRYVPPHCQTYIYAGANDLDRALEWQAKAHDDGASPFYYFSPLIENLHADPRHHAELRRMGLRI
jgi:tetratricopeptide (TPR) repeat protein